MLGRRAAVAVVGLSALMLFSKLVGLVRELVVARTFGAGTDYDAYLVAYTIPEVASFIALHVALYLFVPIYLHERERSAESAERFASAFLLRSSMMMIGLGAVVVAAAGPLLHALAPGMDPSLERTAVTALRILSVVLLARGLEGGFRGLSHSDRRFWIPTFGGMLSSVVVIGILSAWAARYGILALSVAVALGSLMPVAIMAVPLLRSHRTLISRPTLSHPLLAECIRRIPWILAIEACGLLRPLVDRAIATRMLDDGAVSALAYAHILFEVPNQVLGLALSMTLFPEFARFVARADTEGFHRAVRQGVRIAVTMMLPFAVLFVVLREETVRLLFERGAFDASATALTASALWAYAIGLPLQAVAILCMQAAYASRRYSLLLGARLAGLAVKIGASLALAGVLEQSGLALGSALFSLAVVIGLVRPLTGGFRGLIPSPGILVLAAALCGVMAGGLADWLPKAGVGLNLVTGVVLPWLVGLGVYAGICRVGKVSEMIWFESFIRDRLPGRRNQ